MRLEVVRGLRPEVVHGLRLEVARGLRPEVVHGLRLEVVRGLRPEVVHGMMAWVSRDVVQNWMFGFLLAYGRRVDFARPSDIDRVELPLVAANFT